MKKSLKIWLIVWWSVLVVWWAWAWLTKAWVIPNWLWIEVLCSCVDCQWIVFYEWDVPQIDWKECCEWTYGHIEYEKIDCSKFWSKCHVENVNSVKAKPIIYLYPTIETKTNVKLWKPKNLLHTYPKYNPEKWRNVIAQPNGDLEDIETWRKLYALYWEWKSENKTNFDEWFVVAWEDIIPFLEEKLTILWLNEREAEEFIVYWLPQMEDNEYNLIKERYEDLISKYNDLKNNNENANETIISYENTINDLKKQNKY